MISALCCIKTKPPMEGFVSAICQSQSSFSASIVTIKSFSKIHLLGVGCRFDYSRENSGHLPFHHHLPYPPLYQHSTHLHFNGTLPTLAVTLIKPLWQMVY